MRLVLERVILPVHGSLGNGGLRFGSVQRVWSCLVHKLRDGPLLSCWSNVLWGVSRRDLRGCDGGLIVLGLSPGLVLPRGCVEHRCMCGW